MARHFPIFVDLGDARPLVVGSQPGLAAKIRLLAGFAPLTDLVTGGGTVPPALDLPGVRHIAGMTLDLAPRLFAGRPLIFIETGDPALDERLSRRARAMGVPVNVPDKPALCSFYLGSIVDRDPVIMAISTGGFAPVLAQRLRAAIEDWLPLHYGRLALYLNRIRHRIRTLPAARRRRLQHRIIAGEPAAWVIEGDEAGADALVVEMLTELQGRQPEGDQGSHLHVIAEAGDNPARPDRREIEAIRNADVILHPPGRVPDLVQFARREVELVALPPASAHGRAAAMRARGLEVVILPESSTRPQATGTATRQNGEISP